jgi:hypothetical protein
MTDARPLALLVGTAVLGSLFSLGCERGSQRVGSKGPVDAGLIFEDPNNPTPDPNNPNPVANDDGGGGTLPPGCVPEICGNGYDDDCNGMIDDGCGCTIGDTQSCYSGPSSTRRVGTCKDGVATCGGSTEFPVWSACAGDVTPATEVCDSAGLDENCDGAINEGCGCDPNAPPTPCGTDVGECVAGTQVCMGGVLQACSGGVGPVAETCNGKDDDCDGMIDDGLTQRCGVNKGICTIGTQTCDNGKWGACSGVQPTTEVCNGVDDNCNGTVDEGCTCTDGKTQLCGSSTGACKPGTQTCAGGLWGACMGAVGPTTETCNNIDDNCNGKVDENLSRSCGSSVGACKPGIQTCTAGAWGTCTGGVGPVSEICGNGIDDNCDGRVDEGCTNLPPVAICPSAITTVPLATVTLTGSGTDPEGGTLTYHWAVTSAPSGSTSQPTNPNSASTTFFVDLAGSYTLTLTVTDNKGATATCTVTLNSVPPQDLHVELVWDTAYGDDDLHLVPPGVAPASVWYTIPTLSSTPDCWYANQLASWPPAGAAGDATLDIDDTDGYGPENINISTSPASGNYEIGVAFYCSHSISGRGGGPHNAVNPGDGPNHATVKVYCGGKLIATYSNISMDKTGRFVDVATVTWPGCAGKSIMNATWTAQIQPAAYTQPLHCPLPCTKSSDCGGGEVCDTIYTHACVLN